MLCAVTMLGLCAYYTSTVHAIRELCSRHCRRPGPCEARSGGLSSYRAVGFTVLTATFCEAQGLKGKARQTPLSYRALVTPLSHFAQQRFLRHILFQCKHLLFSSTEPSFTNQLPLPLFLHSLVQVNYDHHLLERAGPSSPLCTADSASEPLPRHQHISSNFSR